MSYNFGKKYRTLKPKFSENLVCVNPDGELEIWRQDTTISNPWGHSDWYIQIGREQFRRAYSMKISTPKTWRREVLGEL